MKTHFERAPSKRTSSFAGNGESATTTATATAIA